MIISPYGRSLTNLLINDHQTRREILEQVSQLRSLQLTPRSQCDLELLAVGAFSPLDRFMGRADYESVLSSMRLADGTLFPVPVTLPLAENFPVQIGEKLALRNSGNELLAVLKVEEKFPWDGDAEAKCIAGTVDARHPLVAEMSSWGRVYLSGAVQMLNLPSHYGFTHLYKTPAEVRSLLIQSGYSNVVAFQTRNPIHRAHEEMTRMATQKAEGALLLHPVVGLTKPGDVDMYTRVRCYQTLVSRYYDPTNTVLALLPLAMRMVGPREALWHTIIRRNYGASHFIVGRDHASPGNDSHGRPFYGPYAAQELVQEHAEEIGVTPVVFEEIVYLPDEDRYIEMSQASGKKYLAMSGTQVRNDYLEPGRSLPEWFTHPEVAAILQETSLPRHRQGCCIWFTGLSAAGKSTVAGILAELLLEYGRQSTMLDGDVVRTHLSKGLGFSREDRDTNILRIGFVASEIVRHNGIAICAAISPYQAARNQVRQMVGSEQFILVYVSTPVEVCADRDPKGMYAKAFRGEITGFTGVDDPYEPPIDPDIILDTVSFTPEENAATIIRHLLECRYLAYSRQKEDVNGSASTAIC
jgi:sulfate adenylyltransferase